MLHASPVQLRLSNNNTFNAYYDGEYERDVLDGPDESSPGRPVVLISGAVAVLCRRRPGSAATH